MFGLGLKILVRLPFWVYFIVAAGIGYSGVVLQDSAEPFEEEKALALSIDPPPVVNLADFSNAQHVGPADEVRVQGWINHDYDYEIWDEGYLGEISRDVYLLFGKGDTADSRTVRAALVLSPEEMVQLRDRVDDWIIRETDTTTHLTLHGSVSYSTDLEGIFDEILYDERLFRSADFLFITPFFDGREVGLAPSPEFPILLRNVAWLIAAAFFVIGVLRFIFRRLLREQSPQAKKNIAANLTATKATGMAVSGGSAVAQFYEKYQIDQPVDIKDTQVRSAPASTESDSIFDFDDDDEDNIVGLSQLLIGGKILYWIWRKFGARTAVFVFTLMIGSTLVLSDQDMLFVGIGLAVVVGTVVLVGCIKWIVFGLFGRRAKTKLTQDPFARLAQEAAQPI